MTSKNEDDASLPDYHQVPPGVKELPFPKLTKQHILNCSYHAWHPRYRSITPKARIIPLTKPFVDWLREDGIKLPHDEPEFVRPRRGSWSDSDSGIFSASEVEEEEDEDVDPALHWRPLHRQVIDTIEELGGKVVPKLNWSAPKDATWINATNSMACVDANDVYMLLKASDFITHDLEHAFDGCVDTESPEIPWVLVLRKHFLWNPSLEFRIFVRNRKIIGISQREPQYFAFLHEMKAQLQHIILAFFEKMQNFADENFVVDVYIPPPHERVWLVDINPWAERTDPLLFSWWELLNMPDPVPGEEQLRLIGKDDPEAYSSFASAPYSAHKLPKEVVDAGNAGTGGMSEFAGRWKEIVEGMERTRN
jgi:hypothetical protein